MAYTQTDLDAIDSAIALGITEVTVAGRTMRYRTIQELRDARAHIATQLAISAGTHRAVFYYRTATKRDQ
jgi:hypothetical protein